MKHLSIFLFVMVLCLSISACRKANSDEAQVSEALPTVVHLPEDDSVNGYRTDEKRNQNHSMPNTISADEVSAGAGDSKTDSPFEAYCANINTKVFHQSDCSSVKKTQQSNRYYSSDRDRLIREGYSPCKRCNP